MSANAPGGGGDERRQRLRDQMKAFYGDPNASAKRAAAQAAAASATNPNVPPELDIDSEYFNVNRYTTELLKRESLKGLVETDTELLRRVRKLDGELQELVYRNYARFISATDTIREMKENVVEMDAKLQTLSHNVSTIDGVSSQISLQLQVHRSHIEETITANRMLKKVQFLTSLPTTMRRLIDKEEFNVGVKYWVAGDDFLNKHKSIASITQIQQSCCQLAGELYHAIEQRMCSYPLDDPDAMDRIRSYVEDLRLLRATSLFESAHMADEAPFEESVLRTLMKSVTASFQTNVATTQRSLKAALLIPDDIRSMELTKREASLGQVNLREPLAQLKNACAMLAVNSERVYALLDLNTTSAEASHAAAQVARDIQPVLMEMLEPLSRSLTDFALAHLDAIAMDGGSAMRDPAAVAEALHSATAHLARLLKQLVSAMKTLAEIYLTPLVSAASPTTTSSRSAGGRGAGAGADAGRAASLSVGSPLASENPVQRYASAVHAAARAVVQQCCDHLKSRLLQSPDKETLKACMLTPLVNTSILSALAPSDETHTLKLAFVHTRLLYASLSQCVATALRSTIVGEDGVPLDFIADLFFRLEEVARQLQHRAIVLLGQLEVQTIYRDAFSGGSSSSSSEQSTTNNSNTVNSSSNKTASGGSAAATGVTSTGPSVHTVLLQLLPEWSTVYDAVKALPPITPAASNNMNAGRGNGLNTGGANTASPLRRRETSYLPGGGGAGNTSSLAASSVAGANAMTTTGGYRVGGGSSRGAYSSGFGGAGSSNGGLSDHRGGGGAGNNNNANLNAGGSSHPKSGGKLAVAYTRQVMSALQLSVNNIFANAESSLRTDPLSNGGGSPSATMACVVRYVLQGIVDLVRDELTYSEAQFQQLQISCTYLLYALLSPAKGTAPRQWRKEWSEEDHKTVQRLLDEACSCAYDRYEAKVPLPAAVLEKLVEAAVKGGRAALAAVASTSAPVTNIDSSNTATATVGQLPPAATVDFPDDALIPIPASQRLIPTTGTEEMTTPAPSPQRHDDPLHSPTQSQQRNSSTRESSAAPSQPSSTASSPKPPQSSSSSTNNNTNNNANTNNGSGAGGAGLSAPAVTSNQPSPSRTSVAPPPPSQQQQQRPPPQQPGPAGAPTTTTVPPAAAPRVAPASKPAAAPASTGAQYYSTPMNSGSANTRQSDHAARMNDDEELPM